MFRLILITSVHLFLTFWIFFSLCFLDQYHAIFPLFMPYSACLFSPCRKLNKIPCYRKRALSLSFPFEGAICPIKPFFSPCWLFFVKDADIQSVQTELKNWGWTWTSRRLIVRVMLVQLEQTLKAAGQLQMDFISSQPLHATLLPVPYLSLCPSPPSIIIFTAILFLISHLLSSS